MKTTTYKTADEISKSYQDLQAWVNGTHPAIKSNPQIPSNLHISYSPIDLKHAPADEVIKFMQDNKPLKFAVQAKVTGSHEYRLLTIDSNGTVWITTRSLCGISLRKTELTTFCETVSHLKFIV